MTTPKDPGMQPEIDELLGAYALDAVEPIEVNDIERYLTGNPIARSEVDDLREAAAMLALTANDRDRAPEGLWEKIRAEVSDASSAEKSGSVTSLDRIRADKQARRGADRWLMAAAAFVAAIVLTVGAVNLTRDDTESMGDKYSAAAKDGRVITLADAKTKAPMARVALRSDGSGYFRNDGLHSLPAGKVYQLWVVPSSTAQPVSVGIVRSSDEYTTVALDGQFVAIAVSIEDAPGAVSPTPPIASGAVS